MFTINARSQNYTVGIFYCSEFNDIILKTAFHGYDLLTYCRVASQFIVWGASAAFTILAESSLHCSLSLASSVILTRSLVDWSLKWSISPRSVFNTIGAVVVGRPLSLWPYWMK